MRNRIENCKEASSNPIIPFVDPKGGNSRYVLRNPGRRELYTVQFENCVFKNQKAGKRCDFGWGTDEIVKDETKQLEITFIELKGCDVSEGLKQLLQTIADTEFYYKDCIKKARLVYSGKDRPAHSRNSQWMKKLAVKVNFKDDKNNLIIKSRLLEETI